MTYVRYQKMLCTIHFIAIIDLQLRSSKNVSWTLLKSSENSNTMHIDTCCLYFYLQVEPNFCPIDNNEYTPLHWACYDGNTGITGITDSTLFIIYCVKRISDVFVLYISRPRQLCRITTGTSDS